MQASRPRDKHTTVAIKLLAYPNSNSSPEPKPTAAGKPKGYIVTHPSSFYKSYKSYKSYASVTPPQHAYHRSHQAALHYPDGKSSPKPFQTAASKPTGYIVTPPFGPTSQTGQT